jgi:hypothetical protein
MRNMRNMNDIQLFVLKKLYQESIIIPVYINRILLIAR